jgi:hypothetical protein
MTRLEIAGCSFIVFGLICMMTVAFAIMDYLSKEMRWFG